MTMETYVSKMYKFWQDKKVTDKEFINLVRKFLSNKFSMDKKLNDQKEKITSLI